MFNNYIITRPFRVTLVAVLAFVTAACGSNGAVDTAVQDSGSGTVVVTPPPTPTPPPTGTTTPAPSGLDGEVAVADNFATANGIEPYGVGTASQGQLPQESSEAVGAFRFLCRPAKLAANDPLVYPGQPGASHLHVFAGNTGIDANSNYASLRTTGGTSCGIDAAPVNRSAYWTPVMLDGAGNAVLPDYFNVYYKQLPASDPNCKLRAVACVPLPNGIRYLYGWNAKTMTGGPSDPNAPGAMFIECWRDDVNSERAVNGRWLTIADAAKAGCPAGSLLVLQTFAPECWDGKNLDSPDHRSHVSYALGAAVTSDGQKKCPDGWYLIPDMQVRFVYTTDANFTAGKWRLASDDMMPGAPAGSTLHVDYWEAWSPSVKATWQKYCIDAHKTCGGGALGDGTQIKGADTPYGGWKRHQLVPLSSVGAN